MQFGINSSGWTAIDCGGGPRAVAVSVKTAARGTGRPQVLAAAEEASAEPDSQRDTLRELTAQMERRLPVLITLPRTSYRLRILPEPAVPAREMPSSLRWLLSTEGDEALEEFNLAWMRIPTDEQLPARPRQVYTVTTPTAPLAARVASWRHAGVKPQVVDIRETALRNLAGALERPGEGLALVSADADGVGMVFTHQGSLYLDRYIEFPTADSAGDAGWQGGLVERIALQLHRSIEVITRNYPFIRISRVITSSTDQLPNLHELLARQLAIAVEPLDLSQVFDLTRVPELAGSPALQARCLVPLGATLRHVRGAA